MTSYSTASNTHAANPKAIGCIPSRRRPGIFERLGNAITLMRSRRALARLDASQLADIGLSRAKARREANRPIWDAPKSWRC